MASATKSWFTRAHVIASGSNGIRYAVAGSPFTASITAGTYYVKGDGSSDDLVGAIATAMTNGGGSKTITGSLSLVEDSTEGIITFTNDTDAATLQLDASHAGFTLDETIIGMVAGSTTSAVDPLTLAGRAKGLWFPRVEGRMVDRDQRKARTWSPAISGAIEVRRVAKFRTDRVEYEWVNRDRIKTALSSTNVAFEDFWDSVSDGAAFYWFPDISDTGTSVQCAIDEQRWGESLHEAAQPMADAGGERYRVVFPMRAYVAA